MVGCGSDGMSFIPGFQLARDAGSLDVWIRAALGNMRAESSGNAPDNGLSTRQRNLKARYLAPKDSLKILIDECRMHRKNQLRSCFASAIARWHAGGGATCKCRAGENAPTEKACAIACGTR